MTGPTKVTLLAGGYGGARMAHGFALLGDEVELTVVGNTGDDLEIHGLYVSPDLDTVMYTLAGLANDETGWGVRDETWSARAMLESYGAETWFSLGDRDLATHIFRTARIRDGTRLTAVTAEMASGLGLRATLLPMTDGPVRTKVRTDGGWLDFQHYFVRRHHRDTVREILFDGIDDARPTPEVLAAVESADLIVIAPSNPFVSVAPILALSGVLDSLRDAPAPVVAVSPIVGGAALRGPAAGMMTSLGAQPSATGIAAHYAERYPGLIDVLVIDTADADDAAAISARGMRPLITDTVIADASKRRALAAEILRQDKRAAD